jgi:carbon monoxide dehydrogenase subunit G
MFLVKAAFSEQVEWRTSVERAREFLADLRNFAELMPGVERITAEAGGVARWLIRAEVPVIGSIRQAFSVFQSLNTPARIEWAPAGGEKKNLLRYSAAFEDRGEVTRIRIEQRVELRRQSARELHLLAPLAGESRLSAELQKGVANMMRTFLQRARGRLEKSDE